jgi:hypothetical protein
VRVKNSGPYKDDIALVENTDDSKVWVRLIPRVDLTAATGLNSNAKGKARFNRIPQRINFVPTYKMGASDPARHELLQKITI